MVLNYLRKLLNMFKAARSGIAQDPSPSQPNNQGDTTRTSSTNSSGERMHYGPFPYVSSLFNIVKGVSLEGRIIIESDYWSQKEFGSPCVRVEYMLPSDLKHVYDVSIIRKYTLNEYAKAFKALWVILREGLAEDQLLDLLASILKDLKTGTLEELTKRIESLLPKAKQSHSQEQSAKKE
ncbi:MAG: hypothetical protein LM572_06225, partial [Ignisphaera sp.]|nr:hypothetical protein [Ignisphaera sp.]